jgi:hypothetical protein
MAGSSDLDTVLQSRGGRSVVRVLFFVSLAADVDMLLLPMLIRSGAIQPLAMGRPTHLLFGGIEIALLVGAAVFWLAMYYHFIRASGRGIVLWMLWQAVFIFTIWLGGQIYYLTVFRKQDRSVMGLRS